VRALKPLPRPIGLANSFACLRHRGWAVFFPIFLTAGALRPDYDPLRHTVSSLEFGPTGWIQSLNFILTGPWLSFSALVSARPSANLEAGVRCRSVHGCRYRDIGAGLFAPDPLSGYPPALRPPLFPSLHPVLHDILSTPVFTALPAACIILARRFAKCRRIGWAIYSALSTAMMSILFVMSSIAFAQGSPFTDRRPVTAPHARGGIPLDGTAWAVEFDDTNHS
jgi:hypothetical protein